MTESPSGPEKLVIGVTGAPGSGKTSVAAAFGELGAPVMSLDKLGHELLAAPEVREEVRDTFSSGVFRIMDGEISREKLGVVVFKDPEELKKLNDILHPRMVERVRETLEGWRSAGSAASERAFVLEGALLVEMGLVDACDRVVLVRAPREERLARLARARGWTAEEVARRERAQLDDDSRRRRADAVVENASALAEMRSQVKALWEEWT